MKRTLLITALAVLCFFYSSAQKSSNTTLTLQVTIAPSQSLPENNVKYHSVVSTQIDPLSPAEALDATMGIKDEAKRQLALEKARIARLDEYAKKQLSISGAKFIPVESGEDWTVLMEIGAPKIISVSEKPISELGMEDAVLTYSFSSKLTIRDKTGNIIFEKVLSDAAEEQKMPKAVLFFNPTYKMKMAMTKDPEKQKKLNDQMMEKKDHLILSMTMDQADLALADAFETQVKKFDVSIFSVKGKAYDELNTISDNIFDVMAKYRAFSKKNRIPKEQVDKAFTDAITVWQKYITDRKSELEEKAYKGLLLNNALAYTWVGDYSKAMEYFQQVPEAKKPESLMEEEPEDSGSLGAQVILSFQQSAENARALYEHFNQYKNRLTIVQ